MFSDNEMDLRFLFKLILKKWKIVVAISLVFFLFAFIYSSFFATEVYRVKTSFVVRNTNDSYSYSINELSASRLLVETCAEIIETDEMMQYLSKAIDGKYSAAHLKSAISVRKTDTELMEIHVTSSSFEVANDICYIVSTTLIPHIRENIIKGCDISGLEEVCGSATPISPRVGYNCAVAIVFGAVLGVCIILVSNIVNNKISDAEEFSRRYSIPVLGNIPDISNVSKGGYNYYE